MRLLLILCFVLLSQFSIAESGVRIEPVNRVGEHFQSKIGNAVYKFNGVAVSGHEEKNFIESSEVTVFKGNLNPTEGFDSEGCQVSQTAEPLSFVAGVISIKKNTGEYCEGMAHYNHSIVVEVLKVNGLSLDVITLDEIFNENEIISKILSDKYFNTKFPDIKNKELLIASQFYKKVVLRSFAFHHLKNGKVAVRIYVPNDALSGQVILGLYLTPKYEYVNDFKNSKQAGLLLENIENLFR